MQAPLDLIWALTMDVENWHQLTPTITSVELLDAAPVRVGSRARIAQPRQRSRIWTVTRLEAPHHFEWETRVGTVTMVGTHRLEPTPTGCRNHLAVVLSGPGSGLLAKLAGRQLLAAIATENEGFRRAATGSGAPGEPRPLR